MRSSGIPEIDRAAISIVQLAAPYAPLPDNITERVDVLHITRTWRFESAFGVD
jgi:protein TonB